MQIAFQRMPSGFSLIEILVALLIVGLGLGSYQLAMLLMLRNNQELNWINTANDWLVELKENVAVNPSMKNFYLNLSHWNSADVNFQKCKPEICQLQQLTWQDMKVLKKQLEKLPNARIVIKNCMKKWFVCVELSWDKDALAAICNEQCLQAIFKID